MVFIPLTLLVLTDCQAIDPNIVQPSTVFIASLLQVGGIYV
ncbi:hypothetical protein AB7Y92_16420 [Providencia manganoxydans]